MTELELAQRRCHNEIGNDTNERVQFAEETRQANEDAAKGRHRESEDAMVKRHRESEDNLRTKHRDTEDAAQSRHRETKDDSNVSESRLTTLAVKVGTLCTCAVIITLIWTWHVGRPVEAALGLVPADTVSGKQMAAEHHKFAILQDKFKTATERIAVLEENMIAANVRFDEREQHQQNKLNFIFACFWDEEETLNQVNLTQLPEDWTNFYQPLLERLKETNSQNVLPRLDGSYYLFQANQLGAGE